MLNCGYCYLEKNNLILILKPPYDRNCLWIYKDINVFDQLVAEIRILVENFGAIAQVHSYYIVNNKFSKF
ncbi:hypothetical protein RCL_jg1534.t1 [Rhizophagus clarus]|uniref:Uncharacterized protein n=1 Tax=Rhizophagus clarus TaxID=94130 RepID=A0A8H3L9K8_9GLOM|nr:hypothetical protein RCL_jg1534.t1 [Rhizophagus clarus]